MSFPVSLCRHLTVSLDVSLSFFPIYSSPFFSTLLLIHHHNLCLYLCLCILPLIYVFLPPILVALFLCRTLSPLILYLSLFLSRSLICLPFLTASVSPNSMSISFSHHFPVQRQVMSTLACQNDNLCANWITSLQRGQIRAAAQASQASQATATTTTTTRRRTTSSGKRISEINK